MNDLKEIYTLVEESSQNKENRNFNFYITNNNYKKISVTYELTKGKYWGLNPSFSENDIAEWILLEKSPLDSYEALCDIYDSSFKNKLWNMPGTDEIISKLYFMRTMLAFSHHFYFYYQTDEIADKVIEKLWEFENDKFAFDYIDINQDLRYLNLYIQDKNWRKINGRIPLSIINELKDKKIKYSVATDTSGQDYICLGINEKFPVENLYKDEKVKNCICCVSKTFYSGAMARIDKIDGYSLVGNSVVFNYNFHLSTVSYATHLGFKDPRMNYETIFFNNHERALLLDADKEECILQNELYKKLKKRDTSDMEKIDYINEYLNKSKYTHGMNVSGNIITKDNQLIFTKRGKETWDSSFLYCSVNGVCEINDDKVFFYNHSVNCDHPQIGEYRCMTQGGFGGELSRETCAELNVEIDSPDWEYYGFCVMGYHNSCNDMHCFPLHINILAKSYINQTVEEIIVARSSAVEKDESDNVKSIFYVFKKDIRHIIYNALKAILKVFLEISPNLLIVIVLLKNLFENRITNQDIFIEILLRCIEDLSFADKLSLIIAFFVIIDLVIKIIESVKKIIKYKKPRIYFFCLYKKNYSKFITFVSKRYPNMHSLFVLMSLLFYKDNYEKDKFDN